MITVLISDWLRQVISTKARRRRKVAQVTACGDCGDFHARRSDVCRVRELRVKMLVQQIMGTSKDIKVCNELSFSVVSAAIFLSAKQTCRS